MMMSSCDCSAAFHAPLAADVLSWLSDSLAEPGEALTCGTKDMTAINAAQHGLHELVTAVGGGGGSNSGGGASLRLPLMQPSGHHTHAHAVFMYSTAADGNVTLQLRDACSGGADCTGASAGVGGASASGVSANGGADGVTTLSISYQDIDTDLLGDAAASLDVLLGATPPTSTVCTATLHAATGGDDSGGPGSVNGVNETSATTVLDLFDSSSGGHDLTLSPQTFTSSAEAFINDNSDSLGVPQDSVDVVCNADELKKAVTVATSDTTKLTVKRARPKAASPNRQGPQQCQVCSKVFGNASALAKHKLTHSDERKYVCSMCGKAFKRQDHLNGHMLTHRNKKPYECKADGCGKSYCDARSLRRHTENHHSGGAAVASNSGGATAVAALAGGGGALGGNSTVVSTSTLSPAQGAASGDAASPHGAASSTCIQYAPPPTNGGATELKNAADGTNLSGRTITIAQSSMRNSHGAAGGDSGSTTGAKSTSGKSQLQQLLASEPASKNGGNAPNNDGLTKQQLDLIHQIMEQTQRQSQQITAAAAAGNAITGKSSGSSARTSSTTKPKLSRTWSAPVQTTNAAGGKSGNGTASSPSGNHGRSGGVAVVSTTSSSSGNVQSNGSSAVVVTPKPVECNLCHRKFKNIPALNGHMRLHGGYFKKDAENKKCEKKEATGPPLQTASVSVRALIEEKIISKRTTNPQNVSSSAPATPTTDRPHSTAPPLYPLTASESSSKISTSFVVPAPPNHATAAAAAAVEKIRRHSDTEKFTIPRAPNSASTQQEAEALADLILKRGAKVVKRTASDPGTQHQLQIQFQQTTNDAFALAGVAYQSDDAAGYFSTDDVFHQVQDSMLLQGVDATQLAETIQLQAAASLLQDQTAADQQLQDIASLEDYASVTASLRENTQPYGGPHTVNHELQAVLDSPLPESLAEFSAYAEPPTDPKDGASPLRRFASAPSPRTGSPLVRHDSPGFAYPTPPASHEGQSPGGGGFGGAHLLPMLSPQNVGDNGSSFARTTDMEEPPQASSPLSAAFYTSTMSSSAAVEEALQAVLPGQTINPDDMYPSLTNSPPPAPQSPLSVDMTPVPSPTVPASPTILKLFRVNSPAHVAFPMSSPHHYAALQSQMMPNSEDPLLSSSPKDFATRKRFEFGTSGVQSFRIVSTASGNDAGGGGSLVEIPSGGSTAFSGILVDTNGELKFIQAAAGAAFHNAKNIVVTSTGALSPLGTPSGGGSQGPTVVQIVEAVPSPTAPSHLRPIAGQMSAQPHRTTHHLQRIGGTRAVQCTVPGRSNVAPRPRLHIAVDNLKQEEPDDVFLSPTMIPASPIRASRKRPRSEPALTVPIVHQSRLRVAKGRPPGAAPYTPAPMLNPSRPGPGLYAHAKRKTGSPCSRTSNAPARKFGISAANSNGGERRNCASPVDNGTPESDSTPHINVGCRYQCSYIPDARVGGRLPKDDGEPDREHLLWDPCIASACTDAEVETYLEFACCAAVPGGGRNKEYALHLLHACGGNIHDAMLRLMQPAPSLPPEHPLLAYQYCESDRWSTQEADAFHRALLKHNKDFGGVSREVGTKTVKQCIQFYYVWKKVCAEEYRRTRGTPTASSRDTPPPRDASDAFDTKLLGMVDAEPPLVQAAPTSHPSVDLPRTFTCEYSECSASFNSRAALNGHIRIHGGTVRRSPTPGPAQQQGATIAGNSVAGQQHVDGTARRQSQPHRTDEEFPCKVCGKVFTKIKSRSAHMKSHRPPDAEPKRPPKGGDPAACGSPYDASTSPATPNASVHSPSLGTQ